VITVATKQIINKGASKTIPESANTMSIILFRACPTGPADPTEAKRRSLRVSVKLLIIRYSPKTKSLKSSKTLFAFLYPSLYQINGRCSINRAFNVSKVLLS
jgi:hypothetical protein